MKYYPVYLDLRDRPCVVIGGGTVAERKALALLEAGAEVTIISPALTTKLRELSDTGKITHLQKQYEEKDLSGEFLVIAATPSPEVNTLVAAACRKKHMLVNVAVPPEANSFIVPSVVERGDLLIAISTSGASPALAKKIRQDIEQRYGAEYEVFLDKLSAIRPRVIEEISDEKKRQKIFQALVDSDVIDLIRQGKTHLAELRMAEIAGLKHRG
ncbi:MAG: bifunctional precorrin-2 dehydrogenase/sirohydrochlorin ferrochelatase [Nitrospirae bacterium]|nr:bifunctional precorrin-2 dehydrogenase/sirohydrochlorin ferrochelatase [Nitrospirota bacterium]